MLGTRRGWTGVIAIAALQMGCGLPIFGAPGGTPAGSPDQPTGKPIAIGVEGGVASLDESVVVTVGRGALTTAIEFSARRLDALPASLPGKLERAGDFFAITPSRTDAFNLPVSVTIPYAPSMDEHKRLVVLHWDETFRRWDAVPITEVNADKKRVTFLTRTFSPFGATFIDDRVVATRTPVDFHPTDDGWGIENPPVNGGSCAGMSAFAAWMASAHPDVHLRAWSAAHPEIATELAVRTQAAQYQWEALLIENYASYTIPSHLKSSDPKVLLDALGEPLVIGIAGVDEATGQRAGHQIVAYGYDEDSIFVYDPNAVDVVQDLPWKDGEITEYRPSWSSTYRFDHFDLLPSFPTFGSREDFERMWQEAQRGYDSDAPRITVTSHAEASSVRSGLIEIGGEITGAKADTRVKLRIGGDVELYATLGGSGTWSAEVPIRNGLNTILIFAGPIGDETSTWYPGCGVAMLDLFGEISSDVAVSELGVALTVPTAQGTATKVVVDLYVTDPAGDVAWVENPRLPSGASLEGDAELGDDERFICSSAAGSRVLGGVYELRAHVRYFRYPSILPPPTAIVGIVKVTLDGKETQRDFVIRGTPKPATDLEAAAPGIGGGWVSLGWIDTVTARYVP